MVETALVLGMFLMVVLGICEYGRLLMTLDLLKHAAREGARYACVHSYDASVADIQDRVDQALGGQGKQLEGYDKTTSIEVYRADALTGENLGTWSNAKFGEAIKVRVSGNYKPIVPGFLLMPTTLAIEGECIMRSEAN
jgi:Flp pilus assembly protein TadG